MFWVILIVVIIFLFIKLIHFGEDQDAVRNEEWKEKLLQAEETKRHYEEAERQRLINKIINTSFFKDVWDATEKLIYDDLRKQIKKGDDYISPPSIHIYKSKVEISYDREVNFNDLGYQNITDTQIQELMAAFTAKGFDIIHNSDSGDWLNSNSAYWAPIIEKLRAEIYPNLKPIQ